MADITYTEDQKRVIESRNVNLLVSAAAGSGKTAVLSDRIISLITDKENPIDIDRMLIVTFTKAAAAEMRERIGKNLAKKLELQPDNLELQRQQTLLHNAQITTIDSFCLYIIKNNFGDINLDPGFRTIDEGEKRLMLRDCLDEVLEEMFTDLTEDFRNFVECYAPNSKEGKFEEIIIELFDYVMSNPNPKKWLKKAREDYEIKSVDELFSTKWWKYAYDDASTKINLACEMIREARDICLMEGGPVKYLEIIEEDYAHINLLKDNVDFERRRDILSKIKFDRLPSIYAKDNVDSELKEKCTGLRNAAKSYITDIFKNYYQEDLDTILEEIKSAGKNVNVLCSITEKLIDTFSQKKREGNLIDFCDMEHMALSILTREDEKGEIVPSDAAKEYQEFFDVVMVDEYQDSNYVQEYVLKSVARNNNYFMVGDVKQSIYKFRQAKPEIFMQKYNAFESSGVNTKIDLNKNFRSRQEVLTFSNDIFGKIMKTDICGIEYDDKAKLYLGADYYSNKDDKAYYKPEILVYDEEANEASEEISVDEDDDFSERTYAGEAKMVAMKISNLVKSGFEVYDKEAGIIRPVKYSDIVVLLRSTSNELDVTFKLAMERIGIPAYITAKTGYFNTLEVREILGFLNVIDNPTNELLLYGTLVSYFGGFTKEEIAKIRATYRDISLYEALIKVLGEEYEDEADIIILKKAERLIGLVNEYRELTAYTPIRKLIEKLISDTGYINFVTALPRGAQRKANVYMLLERASDFEKTSFHGLFRFIRYIEGLKAKEIDFGECSVSDSNANVVRIMTDHSSKGLEFPVVFVSTLSKKINYMDSKKSVNCDDEMGIGVDVFDTARRIKRKTLLKSTISLKNKQDTVAEEMRILYVALTRAREKLFVTLTSKNYENMISKLPKTGEYRAEAVLDAIYYSDMILPVLSSEDKLAAYIKCYKNADFQMDTIESGLSDADKKVALLGNGILYDEQKCDSLLKRLSKPYPFENLHGLQVKTSVSDIKHEAYEEENEVKMFDNSEKTAYVPKFEKVDTEEVNGGALRGSAYHRLMELLDFKKAQQIAEENTTTESITAFILSEMDKNLKNGRLSEEYGSLIIPERFVPFFKTNLAKRMINAAVNDKLYREKAFFLGINANDVNQKYPESEIMLVQGVIDAYFEEDGKFIVVDYKTDRINSEEDLVRRYKIQLDYYSEALSRITGKQILAEKIYSFALGREIDL